MATTIKMKSGEGKWIHMTITRNQEVIDVSTATFRFVVKAKLADTDYVLEKVDDDFDKSDGSNGIVSFNISATESAAISPDSYFAELQIIFTDDTDIEKSNTYTFVIERAVSHD